jgi:hypothetical protein
LYGVLVLSVGNPLEPSELLVGYPVGLLALRRDESIGGLVTGSLAHGNSGNSGAGIDDLVSLETLLDVLVEFLGQLRVAGRVESEQVFGRLLFDDTAVYPLA